MQQQPSPNDRFKMLFQMAIIWAVAYFVMQRFMPVPTPPEPGGPQSQLQRALGAEREGRQAAAPSWPAEWRKALGELPPPPSGSSVPQLARTDRIKKLEGAIDQYHKYADANPNSIEEYRARFHIINIYDFLSQYEGESASTHWFDQATQRLKELERKFHGKTGAVTLEVNGEVLTREADLGQLAAWRLDCIRAARDVRNQKKITWIALNTIVHAMGKDPAYSYFLALLVVVVVLKGLTFPFLKKQYEYQRDMMRIQPLLKELNEQMKGRPQEEISRRTMQLFKEHNVNMLAGCLPMLALVVVLWPVFYMIQDYEYQFTYAQFLWVGSAFAKNTWWLADNLAQFDVPLFVTYLLSTVIYSLLQPKPADPQQAQQQKMMMIMMPLVFGFFMWQGQWSSAFMLYWLVLNLVSMYQSWILNKRYGLGGFAGPAPAPAAAVAGGGSVAEPATPLTPMKGVTTPRVKPRRRQQPGPLGASRARGSRK